MRVIIAEDDKALSLFLRKSLELEGHTVTCAADGGAALQQVLELTPDLLILDLGLPVMDGLDVLEAIQGRTSGMATMVLSGRSQLAVRIQCLELGADDFLPKPFSLYELLARCRALHRRKAETCSGSLRQGHLHVDRMTRSVTLSGRSIELTGKEYTLLEYLLLQRGRAVSRKELLREVWRTGPDAGTNVVDVYVNYLRRKLGSQEGVSLIQTVRGEGYAIGSDVVSSKRSLSSREFGTYEQAALA